MVVVLPLLLLVLFGIIDFGFMFQRYVVLTNAAMEGARVGILPGYRSPTPKIGPTTYADQRRRARTVNAVATRTPDGRRAGRHAVARRPGRRDSQLHLRLHRSDPVDVRRLDVVVEPDRTGGHAQTNCRNRVDEVPCHERTRTILVLALSLLVAGAASFLVLRQVQSIPVREIEVRNYQVAVAAKALPMGTLIAATDVKLVPWPQSSPVVGSLHARRGRHESWPAGSGARERTSHCLEGGNDRGRRRPAPDHHARDASNLGEGRRGHRCRRIRGPWRQS